MGKETEFFDRDEVTFTKDSPTGFEDWDLETLEIFQKRFAARISGYVRPAPLSVDQQEVSDLANITLEIIRRKLK